MRQIWLAIVVYFACAASSMPAVAGAPNNTALIDRLTWGQTSQALADIKQLGPDRWLKGQLRPATPLQLLPQARAQIDALRISREPMAEIAVAMDAENKAASKLTDPAARQAAQQAYQKGMADHGHGSVYWMLGGAVQGGRVAGEQVAFSPELLNDKRDLKVLTDYRSLIAELVERLYNVRARALGAIFPGIRPSALSLI
jgi:hypothetical protein